jgi:hypothetical protein
MTLSAADAAKHAIENPFLGPVLGEHQVLVTLAILAVFGAGFLKGFREAIGPAAAAAVPYLALNLVVLARGAWEVAIQETLLADWRSALSAKGDFTLVVAGALLVFPKLALGLSGFETGVSVMPLIDGGEADRGHDPRKDGAPKGRVASTRKLLLTAAGRAIAFLAHKLPAPLRDGAALGDALPAARSGPLRRRRRRHARLPRGRGGAERRLRHGRPRPHPVRRVRGDPRLVAGTAVGHGGVLRLPLPGVRLHAGRQLHRAARRPHHRDDLHDTRRPVARKS